MSVVRLCARLFGALVIMGSATASTAQTARDASGTSWQPDASPMYAVHLPKGSWTLMLHENAFLQVLHESGRRGSDQGGSINWAMGMAERNVGTGRLALRGMLSLEPWTIGGCGYPDLLASGEQCRGETIHDRQHPHDFVSELAAEYNAPAARSLRWQLYAAASGEPALGPVAFPHRLSAMPNPLSPMTHHWFDSTHVSFGVVTGGIYGGRWKVESSAFNGREPDEDRKDFDFGALDSVSARVWFLPTADVALQVSGGHLKEAEAGEAGEPRRDVNRLTASATFHRLRANRVSASTFAWGRNAESGHATNALLIETSVASSDRDTWFGRLEVAQKTAHDLDVPLADGTFTVSKIQGGYTRYVTTTRWMAGLGATVSAAIVPSDLRAAYGRRVNPGVGVFLTLRPPMMATTRAATTGSGTMVMVQTAFDATKLSCASGFDPGTAPSAMYDGKTYYFCSAADRDRFLTDPAMSLSMMPPKQ